MSVRSGSNGGHIDPLRYKLVVFDLDGTLYRQAPVRRAMFVDLLRYGGAPGRYQRFNILRHFRRMREELAIEAPKDFEGPLFARLASRTGYPEPFLIELVREWMEERPLIHLKAAMVAGARDFIENLRGQGVAVTVWSDYPVQAKLKTLDIAVDDTLTASDENVNALKPDPTGLYLAMDQAGVGPGETLMVGDRLTHDGAAATAANVDFLLRNDKAPKKLAERQLYARDYSAFLSRDRELAGGGLAVQNC